MIKELLKKHEGLRLKPYRDTVGVLTIGYGRNLESRGITEQEADMMLENDIKWFTRQLQMELPWFDSKPENVKTVLVNMAFNLGVGGLLGFKNTLKLIEDGKYEEASKAMLKSLWAQQVGARAVELSQMLAG
jgi:lysozyme